MRRGELLACRWKFVDSNRIVLPPEVVKNDEPKEVHLNVFAQKALASLPEGEPDDFLFPDVTPEAVPMAFRHVCEDLGITDIRLHDLRHTFATWLRQHGVKEIEVDLGDIPQTGTQVMQVTLLPGRSLIPTAESELNSQPLCYPSTTGPAAPLEQVSVSP